MRLIPHLVRASAIALVWGIFALMACGVFKATARTVNDVARELCMLWATDNHVEGKLGLAPADFCAVHENLQPFLDAVLAAKQTAGGEVAEKHGITRPPPE